MYAYTQVKQKKNNNLFELLIQINSDTIEKTSNMNEINVQFLKWENPTEQTIRKQNIKEKDRENEQS